jgi:hypothetical protein
MLGLTAYLPSVDAPKDDIANFAPIFDFFARYVRKVHSDRHIKNTLSLSPGMSFLEMIGPSDIAYIITVLKNSKAAWLHNTADKTAAVPKQLFTRGESKKRVFGNTTMNKDGQDYFKEGVKNWKKVFDPTSTGFVNLKSEWEQWLKDDGSVVNTDTWRRKNICSLLAVRVRGQQNQRGDGEDQDNEEESGGEGVNVIEWEYDSDGELGQALGCEQGSSEEDNESIGMGREDACGRQRGDVRQSSGRRQIADDDDDDDDDDRHEEKEEEQEEEEEEDNRKGNYSENDDDSGEEEEDEEMNKKPAARAEPVIHNTRPQNKKDKRTLDAVEEPAKKSKKHKRGHTSSKEGTTGGKTPRPVCNKNRKQF